MAELAAGLVGAAVTVGGAALASASGFAGRHENSHHKEMLDTRRSTEDFMKYLQSGEVTPDEERDFLTTRNEAMRRENAYHDSIESYKNTSWLNPLKKLKKKEDVRRAKRATRQSNHSLRKQNESMYSGSDTSSICASAGSPPGSNLAVDDIQGWVSQVYEAGYVDPNPPQATRHFDTADDKAQCTMLTPTPHPGLAPHYLHTNGYSPYHPPHHGMSAPRGLPVRYTNDAAAKETLRLKRKCFNCPTTKPPSWRRSTLNPGKIVCSKCGLYERTHLRARPLRFDELRALKKAGKGGREGVNVG
ncbi:hypothetical protein C8J57DRAFT_1179725 [Mycena rebaudengoi]|nr:hypothetical protein C8J57DRAFT_1179725 [Mycena rebaudengoi]